MYCKFCGGRVDEDARFCPHCGKEIGGETEQKDIEGGQEKPELLFKTKPVFVPQLVLLRLLPIQIFFTIWGGGFFGGFALAALDAMKLDMPRWVTFVGFGALFFFAVPGVVYAVMKKNYEATEYRVYRDRIEYYEGFFNIQEKIVRFQDIREVELLKGIFQRKYGLGTVVLRTAATFGVQATTIGGQRGSGIKLVDVENAEELYEKLKELVR